ncbi:lipid phosphate phosphatase 1 [Abortiporus biennis]|nr:lipid phosphate phosphatase 1 [Abortiporus biennis]
MAGNFLPHVRARLNETFKSDSFQWFDRAYVVDWIVVSLAWLCAWAIKGLTPFERVFTLNDPLIGHDHKPNQISGDSTWFIALLVPLLFIVVVGTLRTSALEIHHGALALWAARGSNALITEALKNRVGRLRPDFLSRCKWTQSLETCSGKLDKVMDGRRSFPSGHSSTAFCGMMFLALWLAGTTGTWSFHRPSTARSLFSSKQLRMLITVAPLGFATWVAISRLEDNRHHKEDVIVGSVIGIVTATVAYLIYWPNPFTLRNADLDRGMQNWVTRETITMTTN